MFYAALSGFTDLHRAAQRGDDQEVLKLLQEGADPSAKDSEGRTPLHHAVMRGHLAVVDELLKSGGPALLLAKDILNCTPVHLAAVQNQVTLILRLVESLLEDTEGRTALHEVARRRCMQDFMGFLHLGWESATQEDDSSAPPLCDASPLWDMVGQVVDLRRPGLPTLQRVLGWHPMHVAAMSGNIELIKRLVQQFDCDLRVKSMNSWTPLHYAAAYNQVAAIEAMCALGCDVAVQDAVGSTPMHVAAGEGHLEAIHTLVRLGCSPQVTDRDGCTPLYCAAAWNRIEAVRLLEQLHCPSSLRSLEGRTPIHVAAEQGWVALLNVLVTELGNAVDSRDNYQFTPLHSAANGGHVEAIRRLAALHHDLNAKDYMGRTPLHYAAMHGRTAAVEALVKLGAGLQEKDSRGGYTPLHLAADAGQCEVISQLVGLGAEVDAPASKALPPLALALLKGPANVDAIALLVELGADVDSVLEARNVETPLHVAARSGRLDIVERLINVPRISVAARTKDGSTPLHYAAAFGQTHVLETLVNAGCPVDARDNALNTPLHLAAGCGFLDTVMRLVELGGDINARDCTDCTPLQNAAHGTYSALAAMPPNGGGAAGAGVGAGGSSPASGYARFNPPHQPQLTPAQQAAQAALTSGSTVKRDGLVPVRTGLAWSQQSLHAEASPLPPAPPPLTLPGSSGLSAALDASAAGMGGMASAFGGVGGSSLAAGGAGSSSSPTHDLWTTWKSLGLTQLLKKAYKQQQKRGGGSSASATASQAAAAQLAQTQQTVQAALQQMQAALQQSQAALQQQLLQQLQQSGGAVAVTGGPVGGSSTSTTLSLTAAADATAAATATAAGTPALDAKATVAALSTPPVVGSETLDTLLRRSEQLHLSTGEQDRSRLVKVVEKLVDLGGDLQAVDNEGRTALHLAAGCGDRQMALRLVELGTDVNCRDSVGGTAMHHAAMANKKDMMFSLARLGCDWRARAEGIDGATASFVLCGQHGKTTRQQRLLDAKLKRVYQEGSGARAAGRNPLADAGDEDIREEEMVDRLAGQALADAAMAALLEEVEAEAQEEEAKKSKKKKKKGKKPEVAAAGIGEAAPAEEASCALSSEPSVEPPSPPGGGVVDAASEPQQQVSEEDSSSAAAAVVEAPEHVAIREALEGAAAAATKLLAEHEDPSEDSLVESLDVLDEAVDAAVVAGVSAKYGKKVRKKLQTALDRARGVIHSEPTPSPPPQPPNPVPDNRGQPAASAAHQQQQSCAPPAAAPAHTSLQQQQQQIPWAASSGAAPPSPAAAAAAARLGPGFSQGSQRAMLPAQVVHKQHMAAVAAAQASWSRQSSSSPGPQPPVRMTVQPQLLPPQQQQQQQPSMGAPPGYSSTAAAAAALSAAQNAAAAAAAATTHVPAMYAPPLSHHVVPQQQPMTHRTHLPQTHSPLFPDKPAAQQQPIMHPPPPPVVPGPRLGLFDAPQGMYDTTSPAGTPSPHSAATALFGGGSLFGSSTAATSVDAGAAPHGSNGYGSVRRGSYDAAPSATGLPSRFADLELSGGPQGVAPPPPPPPIHYSPFTGSGPVDNAPSGALDSFIGHDLVAQVFGGGSNEASGHLHSHTHHGGHHHHAEGDPVGSSLLSTDLLGAIDGTGMSAGPLLHGGLQLDGAGVGLSLPGDTASLFSPPGGVKPQPQFGRTLW